MKILIVCGIFPPDIGGPARYIPTLAKALLARGHHVAVVTLADHPELAQSDEWPFPVHRIKRRQFMLWRIVRTIARVARLASASDVILANTLGLEAALGGLLGRRPVINKVVGDYAWERARSRGWFQGTTDDYQTAKLGWRLRLLNQWRTIPLRMATEVFTPSRYLERMVWGWGVPAARTTVIYNSYARPTTPRPHPPVSSAPPVVITVCRLVTWKHVDGIIEAVSRLEHGLLWIVGDGPLRAALEAQVEAAADLRGRVIFWGQLDAAEVMQRMQQADIFVLNSSYEGLPHVVIEAMGAGLPVIATPAGGTPELVRPGETGVLVDAGDTDGLAAALRRLLQSPEEACRLAENGRRLVEERFGLERMLNETEILLRNYARG